MKPVLPTTIARHLSPPWQLTPLVDGTSNSLFRVATATDTLVWRQFPEITPPGVSRTSEQTAMKALQGFDWVPEVLAWDASGMLMRYYPLQAPNLARLTIEDRQALVNALLCIWSTPVDSQAYDYPALVRRYAALAPDTDVLQALQQRLLAQCEGWPRATPYLIHSDLHPGNVWRTGSHWLLLDWEYASPGNPWIDAVCVHRWFHFTDSEKSTLEPVLRPWAVPGDSWRVYADWLAGLDQLWTAAHDASR